MARGRIEKRETRKRKIKPVVLIVTEGSKTEPNYFNHFCTRRKNIDVRIVGSRSSAGETDYNSLIRKAKEYQEKNDLTKSPNWISIFIAAFLPSVLLIASGHIPIAPVVSIPAGIVAALIAKNGNYKSFKWNAISHMVFSWNLFGGK